MAARTDLDIRAARPGDAEQIAALHVAAWQSAFEGLFDPADLAALDVAVWTESWRGRLNGQGSSVATLVAVEARVVLGFVTVGPCRVDPDDEPDQPRVDQQGPDEHRSGQLLGEVWAIYVRPDQLGRGVGGALMRAGLAKLAAEGYAEAVLWTPVANGIGRAFYERGGWRPDGGAHDYTFGGRTVPELRYRMRLTGGEPAQVD